MYKKKWTWGGREKHENISHTITYYKIRRDLCTLSKAAAIGMTGVLHPVRMNPMHKQRRAVEKGVGGES